ncbi:hypothetical protein HK101_007298 [Irineochytrium annulatum]|nr:hypothetical protein HK101_007298 [Irineochytrium annulatum]
MRRRRQLSTGPSLSDTVLPPTLAFTATTTHLASSEAISTTTTIPSNTTSTKVAATSATAPTAVASASTSGAADVTTSPTIIAIMAVGAAFLLALLCICLARRRRSTAGAGAAAGSGDDKRGAALEATDEEELAVESMKPFKPLTLTHTIGRGLTVPETIFGAAGDAPPMPSPPPPVYPLGRGPNQTSALAGVMGATPLSASGTGTESGVGSAVTDWEGLVSPLDT